MKISLKHCIFFVLGLSIDLGKEFFTAEVVINGKQAGKRINAPYTLIITNRL